MMDKAHKRGLHVITTMFLLLDFATMACVLENITYVFYRIVFLVLLLMLVLFHEILKL